MPEVPSVPPVEVQWEFVHSALSDLLGESRSYYFWSIDNQQKWFESAFGLTHQYLEQTEDAILNNMVDMELRTNGDFATLEGKIGDYIDEKLGEVQTHLSDKQWGMSQGINQLLEETGNLLNSVGDGVSGGVSNLINSLNNGISSLSDKITNSLNHLIGEINGLTGGLWNPVLELIEDMAGGLISVGEMVRSIPKIMSVLGSVSWERIIQKYLENSQTWRIAGK